MKAGVLLLAAAGAGLVLVLGARSSAQAPSQPASLVQTATVGDRTYTVARLGGGVYLVMLTLSGGVPPAAPVEYTFSQSGPMGEFGDASALEQLKADLPHLNVNFAEGAP